MARTLQEILGTKRGRDLVRLPSLPKITIGDIVPDAIERSVRNFFAPQPIEQGVRVRDILREIPGTVKQTFLPTRGFTEEELRQADPTLAQRIKSIPKLASEIVGGAISLGELLGDIEGLQKFSQTKAGGVLADIGGTVRRGAERLLAFAEPKNVEEAAALRVSDIGFLAIGNIRVPRSAAVTIARSKNAAKITRILKQEVPGIADNAAKTMGQILVHVDDADDVMRVLNRTNFALNKAKGIRPSQALIRAEQPTAAVTPRRIAVPATIAPATKAIPVDERLAVEARKIAANGGNMNPLAQEARPTFQFVSPNVETGLDYSRAVSRLEMPPQLNMKVSFRRIDDELFGNVGKTRSAVGDWLDGAENTTYFVGKNVDKDTLIYSTAVKSKIAYQKQGIWFKAGEGADELYRVSIEGKNPAEVKKIFDEAGIQYKTIGKHEALVFNKSGDYFDTNAISKLDNAMKKLGIKNYDVYRGEGDFIGSFLENVPDKTARLDAMKIYDDIIRNYEMKTGKISNVLREEAASSLMRGAKNFNEFIGKFERSGDKYVVSFNQ